MAVFLGLHWSFSSTDIIYTMGPYSVLESWTPVHVYISRGGEVDKKEDISDSAFYQITQVKRAERAALHLCMAPDLLFYDLLEL